jgi:hypothetical protein
MFKKTSKYIVFSGVLLVFSLLLASCQSLIASTAEKNARAVENWETYFEEMEQANVPPKELRSDVSSESEAIVDAYSPRIEIERTWLDAETYKASYTVMSDRPAWVVFHAEENGAPGAILEYIFVESGTHSFSRTEVQGEMNSEEIFVMLHEDLGRIGLFEFPGPDSAVYVDNTIVNELCFCPF